MNKFMKIMFSFTFAFTTMLGVGAFTEVINPTESVSAAVDCKKAENKNHKDCKKTATTTTTSTGGTSLFDDNDAIDASDATDDTEANKIIQSIYRVANVFAGVVLAVSVIMIILGGLKYIMANGDPRQAESGKMILIYSGIGIVIALSAFVIARLFASFQFIGS